MNLITTITNSSENNQLAYPVSWSARWASPPFWNLFFFKDMGDPRENRYLYSLKAAVLWIPKETSLWVYFWYHPASLLLYLAPLLTNSNLSRKGKQKGQGIDDWWINWREGMWKQDWRHALLFAAALCRCDVWSVALQSRLADLSGLKRTENRVNVG